MTDETAPARARQRSLALLPELGFPAPPSHFPILDTEGLRSEDDVIDRALALNVIINLYFGMPPQFGEDWLKQHGLIDALTPNERELISGRVAVPQGSPLLIEGLWLLVYSLGLIDAVQHDRSCGDELASKMPKLHENEDPSRFRDKAQLRKTEDLLFELDLLYCLTWGLANAKLLGEPAPGEAYPEVIWARRAAAEWIFGDDWDNPDLST